MKRLIFIALTIGVMFVSHVGSSNADVAKHFRNIDIKGTWALYNLQTYIPAVDWSGWVSGTVIFDGKGKIVGGSGTTWDGYNSTITGGTYKLEKDGTFTATVEVSEGSGETQIMNAKGSINLHRDTITAVGVNTIRNTPSLSILVKKP